MTVWRVFVGNHGEPKITAFDLGETDRRWSFEVAGQAKLFPAAGGAGVVAVQSDADAVAFLRSGVRFESHGDHGDIEVEDPALLPATIEGPRPFHLINHDGVLSINFDRGGYAALLPQERAAEGELAATEFPQSHAHHGFVTPFGDVFLGSVASDVFP